jgi:hypothetical protein
MLVEPQTHIFLRLYARIHRPALFLRVRNPRTPRPRHFFTNNTQ